MSLDKKYKRIIILGSGGSGKTTLARFIGKKLNIPVYHLDKEYWLPNWERPDEKEWEERVKTLIKEPSWIMDGNYIDTLDIRLNEADLVIMLDIKKSLCVASVIYRNIKGHFVKRTDIGDGCKDSFDKHFFDFISWVKAFKTSYYSKLINLCIEYPNIDIKLFTTRKGARQFIERIKDDYENE